MKSWQAKIYGAEFKVSRLQDAPLVEYPAQDNPSAIYEYLQPQLAGSPCYRGDVENLIVIYLTSRRRPITWQVVTTGTLDCCLVHPREVFRAAIVINAAAIILCHNHPSGCPDPSEADVKMTRDMVRAGQLMKIDVLDHVIIGEYSAARTKPWASLRELGYFYTSP